MFRVMRNDRVRKGVQLALGLMFVGSLMSAMFPAHPGASVQRVAEPLPEDTMSFEQVLQDQARGYELVLVREPHNQTALEGLAQTRLDLNDPAGAIAPLETLVKLYPDHPDYKTQLAAVQQQIQPSSPQP